MVSQDSVLATSNYFVTVDKINSVQPVRDLTGTTILQKVSDRDSIGFYIHADCFEIGVSPYQKFITEGGKAILAQDLREGMVVLTYFGWAKINHIMMFTDAIPMSNIVTKSQFFLCNGFYLVGD